MTHPHPHHAHDPSPHAWEERAAWLEHVVEALEPELRHATDALLDAVGAGPGVRLLDLACGVGDTTAAAAARGADALGIDFAPGMIAAARRRFPGLRFDVGDMLDPPAGPWDAVTCRLGAHHVDARWMTQALRVLVPGGRLAMAELAPIDAESVKNGMRPASHWVDALEKAGFVDVDVATREVKLGTLAARDPLLAKARARGHGGGFHDGPVHVISGRAPTLAQRATP